MAQDDLLSQEEIDALLNGPGGDDESPVSKEPRMLLQVDQHLSLDFNRISLLPLF